MRQGFANCLPVTASRRHSWPGSATCLLVRHELEPAHDLTPWLAGLVVDSGHRGRGIATALVRATEAHAASRGVEMLHLYTWEARDFYAALGWDMLEVFEQDGTMALMARRLHL